MCRHYLSGIGSQKCVHPQHSPKVQESFPSHINIRSGLTMSTLSRRLQRIQERVEVSLPTLESLSLEQMEKQVMDFGKAHVGKCYRQMWDQEQAYISWFVSHYQASTKLEHRKFLQYITCKVDRAELTGERIPVKPAEKDLHVFTGKGYGKQSPKAKSRSGPMASTGAIPEAAMDEMHQLVQKGFCEPGRSLAVPGSGSLRDCSERGDPGRANPSRDRSLGKPNVEPGERSEPRDPASGGVKHTASNTTGGSIDPDWDRLEEAGDLSADCFVNNDSGEHINHERKYFQSLVCTITQELEQCLKEHAKLLTRPSLIDILEVFCSSDSQITHQCQQLGFRARRFDFSKGDLQTPSGRRELFHELIHHRPRHVWVAPSCGPWSSWSHLNGNRSLEAWDNLHATRREHVSQVALGIVLLRYQR